MNPPGCQSNGPKAKRLSLEQKICRIARRYRARERRLAVKAATVQHRSCPWWTSLAGALALLIVPGCMMSLHATAANPPLDSQIICAADIEQNHLEKAARVPGVNTLAWVGCLATVLMFAGISGGRLLLSAVKAGQVKVWPWYQSARLSLTPALFRWERENRTQSHGTSSNGICRKHVRKQQSVRWLFPLPAGEGQGEGERCHPLHRRLQGF